jgi:hypothetical protein
MQENGYPAEPKTLLIHLSAVKATDAKEYTDALLRRNSVHPTLSLG